MPYTIVLTEDETLDLYFEISKAVDRHQANIERYKAMGNQQAIKVEQKKIKNLLKIKEKLEECLK